MQQDTDHHPERDDEKPEGDSGGPGDVVEESVPAATKGFLDAASETTAPATFRERLATIRFALVMVWKAARWRGVLITAGQAIAAAGVGAQLLAGNNLLTQALSARAANRGFDELIPGAVAFTVVASGLAVLRLTAEAQRPVLEELVECHAHSELMAAACRVDLIEFEDPVFFDRLKRATVQGGFRPMLLAQSASGLVAGAMGAAGVAVALFSLAPILVLMATVAAVPLWISTKRNAEGQWYVSILNTPAGRERDYLRHMVVDRPLAAELRVFNLAEHLRDRHDRVSGACLRTVKEEAVRRAWRTLLGTGLSGIAAALAGGTLLVLLVNDRLAVAAALTSAIALQQLRSRVVGIATGAAGIFESALFLKDYADVVAMQPRAPRPPRPQPLEPFRRLAGEGVSFRYPGSSRDALDRVDIHIEAGEVVALVGENGSGKTTLAKLLCTLYEPTAGRITWDGIDMRELDPSAVRDHVAVIFQDFVRYAFSAKANVTLGRVDRIDDDEAFRRAVEVANLESVFAQLPHGEETVLGRQFRGGHDLSGGQWQRVALARAVFRDAPFIVMDEPSAALDARAEHELFQRVRTLAAGRAVLLITHRFGNVRMADRIYVLHRGRVEESGTHDELVRSGGRYAELFNLQASHFVD